MNPTWQQGDYIIKGPDKRKILGVCGEIVFPSMMNVFDIASGSPCTQHEFEVEGYSLVPPVKEWPLRNDKYWWLYSSGEAHSSIWQDDSLDHGRKAFGNVHRSKEDAEAWAEKVRALKK